MLPEGEVTEVGEGSRQALLRSASCFLSSSCGIHQYMTFSAELLLQGSTHVAQGMWGSSVPK